MAESQQSDKLEALAREIRAHADVYKSAVALAAMLELLGPYEEAEQRARDAAVAAQAKLGQIEADVAAAERRLAAVRSEHERATKRMRGELEGMLAAREKEIDAMLAEKLAALRVQETALSTGREQLAEVNKRLERVRELFA